MTGLRDHPLSRVELMVLARLSVAKPPTAAEIAKSLRQIGTPLTGAALADCVTATLAAVQGRALVATAPEPVRTKRAPATSSGKRNKGSRKTKLRFRLTESGRLALRDAFELRATPTWDEMCERIVPALALGERPGTQHANQALASTGTMTAALLGSELALGESLTVAKLCDQVIARALGMPRGPVTFAGIRAYALAMHCSVDDKAEIEDIAAKFAPTRKARSSNPEKLDRELTTLAGQFASKHLRAKVNDKEAMTRALLRHWVSQQDEADGAHRTTTSWSTPLQPSQTTIDAPSSVLPSALLPRVTPAAEGLLTAVREAIPMVGADGRYGKENVFVSALWRQLARDRRLPDLSLDHFKRWLVDANRDQLLALGRADLVDDMDARLVEDSEIEDLGATFHFVIDRREPSSAQVHHAR